MCPLWRAVPLSCSHGGMSLALVKSLVLLAGLDSVSAYIMKCIPRKKPKEILEFTLHACYSK